MTRVRLVLRSLLHHWRINLAVALGVMAGTAVLSGALLVGDSVRGSLRHLALDRLGQIDEVLVAPRFFRQELAAELASEPDFKKHFDQALPAILMPGTLASGATARVQVVGVGKEFWRLGEWRPVSGDEDHAGDELGENEVVLSASLAQELHIARGDSVTLTLRRVSQVSGDSTFGRKEDYTVSSSPLKVAFVVRDEGLGRFGLRPNQQLPANVFAPLSAVQMLLEQNEIKKEDLSRAQIRQGVKPRQARVNAILVTSQQPPGERPADSDRSELDTVIRPRLADYGLKLQEEKEPIPYFNLTSDGLMLDEPVEQAANEAFRSLHAQPALTYLANLIWGVEPTESPPTDRPVPGAIPYCMITAVDFGVGPGEWKTVDGQPLRPLKANEIALNKWAFDSLNLEREAAAKARNETAQPLKVGDTISVTYFLPEHIEGGGNEETKKFTLKAVLPLGQQSPANDRNFTPELPGVTDAASVEKREYEKHIRDYHAERVRVNDESLRNDDDYWQEYGPTPMAFVSLETGRDLWGTRRFGYLTSFRIPAAAGRGAASLKEQLRSKIDPAAMGFRFQTVKAAGLKAATGTTPFSVLFVSFSFFIIAAAVMLVAILFRLGVESRADEIGTLLAEGFSRRKVLFLLAGEGLLVAALGGLAGVLVGVGYAALMLYGLRNWWVDAIATPFLSFHWTWTSLIVGYFSGVLVSFLAVAFTLWRMRRVAVRRLLAGQAGEEQAVIAGRPRVSRIVAFVFLAVAAVLVVVAVTMGGEAQTGAFFGSGFAMLAGLLALLWGQLRGEHGTANLSQMPIAHLAVRNGARNPGRSTLTIGLVASAAFLIIALSAFQSDPSQHEPKVDSGNGGFSLAAESATPVLPELRDVNDVEGLQEDVSKLLQPLRFYSLRVQPGEDASCKNLYQTTRPRVLGLPSRFINRGGFAWSGTLAETPEEEKNPWLLLTKDAGKDEQGRALTPIVLDANTATYSLKLGLGDTLVIQDDWGRKIPLKLVGLLKNSIFQGDVLMGEQALLEKFPNVAGYQFFLMESPTGLAQTASGKLENALKDHGFDAQTTGKRLAGFLAVQNTYISTFQSLGALGLLLGTFGLATVQLRNVLERRGELALLRAAGFRRGRLAQLVMAENAFLLVAGLAIGGAAAVVAVSPHLFGGDAAFPLRRLTLTMLAILAAGLAAGLVAVWATLKAPLIQALRGD